MGRCLKRAGAQQLSGALCRGLRRDTQSSGATPTAAAQSCSGSVVPVPLSFQAWKAHLMGPMGCTLNLRRTHLLPRPPALPPGKGPATTTSGTSGPRGGSKIPTPKGGLSRRSGRTCTKR